MTSNLMALRCPTTSNQQILMTSMKDNKSVFIASKCINYRITQNQILFYSTTYRISLMICNFKACKRSLQGNTIR